MEALETIYFQDADYKEVLVLQERYRETVLTGQRQGIILYGTHQPVITYGRGESLRDTLPLETISINRGGKATHHYPGQIIVYPLLQLKHYHLDIKSYIQALEDICKTFLEEQFQLKADTNPPATGVWMKNKKVAAIGISVKKGVTMHGFAVNILDDLAGYFLIKPCGFEPHQITSIETLLQKEIKADAFHNLVHALAESTQQFFQHKLYSYTC